MTTRKICIALITCVLSASLSAQCHGDRMLDPSGKFCVLQSTYEQLMANPAFYEMEEDKCPEGFQGDGNECVKITCGSDTDCQATIL